MLQHGNSIPAQCRSSFLSRCWQVSCAGCFGEVRLSCEYRSPPLGTKGDNKNPAHQEPPPHRPTRLRQDDRHPPADRAVDRPSPWPASTPRNFENTASESASRRLACRGEGNSGSCRLQVEAPGQQVRRRAGAAGRTSPNRIGATRRRLDRGRDRQDGVVLPGLRRGGARLLDGLVPVDRHGCLKGQGLIAAVKARPDAQLIYGHDR